MKPKKSPNQDPQSSLFQVELAKLVDMRHPLVQLAGKIDWQRFEAELECCFSDTDGAPAKPTRLMVGLHYLKHTYNLSDEQTVKRWVENPYWQYFCGMKYFEYSAPIHPSLMTRWRKMLGDGKMEKLLEESIATGFRTGTVNRRSLENVNVDTTVQEKAIAFPTDARLYQRMLETLVKKAKKRGVVLRQSYQRVSKIALVQSGRYFHARQAKRARREVRRLRTMLGRVTRDIVRKISGSAVLEESFRELIALSHRLLAQKKDDKNKLYSLHAPEVECISKGKAHKKYEFGNKASFVTSSREGFAFGAQGLHGNPYDGHTLTGSLQQAARLCGGKTFGRAFVDRGYRGHGYEGPTEIHICDPRTGRRLSRSIRRWRKRRSAIEPAIGHMKNDGRLGRNYLLGKDGDRINVVLSAVGHNLRLILAKLARTPVKIFFLLAWMTAFFRRFGVTDSLRPMMAQ